jgi:hypothetical protein
VVRASATRNAQNNAMQGEQVHAKRRTHAAKAAPNPLSMTHFPNAFQMRRCEEREGARGKGFVVRNPSRTSPIGNRRALGVLSNVTLSVG